MDSAPIIKIALRLDAIQQNAKLGIAYNPPIREPLIIRRHVDGPYLRKLNGTIHWLTALERLLTKVGVWNAWDIEVRHSPIFSKARGNSNG